MDEDKKQQLIWDPNNGYTYIDTTPQQPVQNADNGGYTYIDTRNDVQTTPPRGEWRKLTGYADNGIPTYSDKNLRPGDVYNPNEFDVTINGEVIPKESIVSRIPIGEATVRTYRDPEVRRKYQTLVQLGYSPAEAERSLRLAGVYRPELSPEQRAFANKATISAEEYLDSPLSQAADFIPYFGPLNATLRLARQASKGENPGVLDLLGVVAPGAMKTANYLRKLRATGRYADDVLGSGPASWFTRKNKVSSSPKSTTTPTATEASTQDPSFWQKTKNWWNGEYHPEKIAAKKKPEFKSSGTPNNFEVVDNSTVGTPSYPRIGNSRHKKLVKKVRDITDKWKKDNPDVNLEVDAQYTPEGKYNVVFRTKKVNRNEFPSGKEGDEQYEIAMKKINNAKPPEALNYNPRNIRQDTWKGNSLWLGRRALGIGALGGLTLGGYSLLKKEDSPDSQNFNNFNNFNNLPEDSTTQEGIHDTYDQDSTSNPSWNY